MGTHCLVFMRVKRSDGTFGVWAIMYMHWDGGHDGVGRDLALILSTVELVNGLPLEVPTGIRLANGPGCLFAQIVAHFKKSPGNCYLVDATDVNRREEYNYTVDVDEEAKAIDLGLLK